MLLAALSLCSMLACTKEGSYITVPTKTSDTTKTVTPPVTTPVQDSFQLRDTGITIVTLSKAVGNMKQYLQYIPAGYNEKKTYKWPIVFFLHGTGEIGNDANVLRNVGLPKVSAGKQFIIIAPQCTANWWNLDALQTFYLSMIKQYHIDSSRIYLTGLSMGGMQTWDWAIDKPAQFAAIVPISANGDTSKVKVLKNLPVWVFHNADDPTVSVWGDRLMVDALKNAGGNVKYTENATGGHDAWDKAYAMPELYTWLLAQKKP
ncbi:hypothetical protein GA0116948_103244 [Chitinophaga costaii]|uniref:Phospholipase/Carboxylesterase n=2 Tax=Chitinophaga costaii TaxID=1335309 RepID=A0A1C4BSV0_9BACT|nr:hypothetical protein GA0116948_103244 [Chitinophaga costaii]